MRILVSLGAIFAWQPSMHVGNSCVCNAKMTASTLQSHGSNESHWGFRFDTKVSQTVHLRKRNIAKLREITSLHEQSRKCYLNRSRAYSTSKLNFTQPSSPLRLLLSLPVPGPSGHRSAPSSARLCLFYQTGPNTWGTVKRPARRPRVR